MTPNATDHSALAGMVDAGVGALSGLSSRTGHPISFVP
jgi:hypothetical protein